MLHCGLLSGCPFVWLRSRAEPCVIACESQQPLCPRGAETTECSRQFAL